MKFHLEHPLPKDATSAWKIITSTEFATQSYAQSGTKREVISIEERNGLEYSSLRITLEEELPAIAAKTIGSNRLSWIQNQIMDNSKQHMRWKISIPGKDFLQAEGVFYLQITPTGCTRVVDGDVTVKIPLMGRKIEEHICKKLQDSYEKSAQFTIDWCKKNG